MATDARVQPDGYAPQLDGLRAVAVVAVAYSHWLPAWQAGVPFGAGVHLFFVLSGFLITRILLALRAAPRRGPAVARFYARRAVRLFPAFYLVLGLAWLADVPLVRDTWTWHAAYLSNVRIAGEARWLGHVSHFWSLAVEEQFYVLVSASVLVASRTTRPVRNLSVFVAIGWCLSAGVQLFADWPQYRLEFGTGVRAAELLSGSALAILLHRHPTLPARLGSRLQPIGVVALAVIIGLAATTDYDPPWLLRGGYAALSIVNAALVVALLTPGPLTRALSWAPAVRIGRLSYSWYLVHWPVILVLTPERTGLDTWALLATKVVVSLLVAMTLHHGVEQPLRRLEPPRRLVVATWIGGSLVVAATALIVL